MYCVVSFTMCSVDCLVQLYEVVPGAGTLITPMTGQLAALSWFFDCISDQ